MNRIIDRFDKYMEQNELNDNKVTVSLKISVGLLGKSRVEGKDLSKKIVEKILNFYNDINPKWLLTGEGPMLKHPEPLTKNEDMDPKTEERIIKFEKDLELCAQQLMKKDDIIIRLIEANVQLQTKLNHMIDLVTNKQESEKKQAM
jgi:hypothetical protein